MRAWLLRELTVGTALLLIAAGAAAQKDGEAPSSPEANGPSEPAPEEQESLERESSEGGGEDASASGDAPTDGSQPAPDGTEGPATEQPADASGGEPETGDTGGGRAAAGGPAHGGEKTEGDIENARKEMEQGQELYAQGRFAEAASRFLAAFEATPHSAFLYNAAVAYERAGEPGTAADYFARYLSRDPNAADAAEVRQRVERLRTEALGGGSERTSEQGPAEGTEAGAGEGADTGTVKEQERPTDAIAPEVPAEELQMKSLLSVKTEPAGARVTLERKGEVVATGGAPFAQTLTRGDYELQIEHPDYRTVEESVHIGTGKVYVVIVEMSQGQFLGYLRVVTSPPGAKVYMDDRREGALGRTPWQNAVSTGEHTLWLERPGFEAEKREVQVGIGEQRLLETELTRVDYGKLRVVANVSEAAVFVDDERVGTVPYEGDHPAGEHRVRVEAEDRKSWQQRVDVKRGRLTPVRVQLKPAVDRGGAWASLVASTALAGGGIALMMLGDGIESDLEDARDDGTLESNDSRLLEGRVLTIGADVAFGLGGLMAVLTFYYFVRDPLPDSEGRVLAPRDWAVAPHIGPYGGGAKLQWSF